MKNGIFRILALGDVVGSGGVRALEERLRRFRGEHGIDLAIVNGENSAPRNGIDPESAQCILAAGADAITTGNHVWRQKQMHDSKQKLPRAKLCWLSAVQKLLRKKPSL